MQLPEEPAKKKPAPYVTNLGDNVLSFEFEDGTSFTMYEDQATLMARTIYDVVEQWWDEIGWEELFGEE